MGKKNKKQDDLVPVVQNSLKNFGSLSSKTAKIYTYKGKKNQTEFPDFVNLCLPTQEELKAILPEKLIDAGYIDIVVDDGFIYAKGEVPVLLTAHMDTVHKTPVIDYYEYVDEKGNHIISSPQGIGGDDRCGIYMILEIIKEHKCSVLFCEDEEIGGDGSDKFCKTEFINELADLRYLIELDRANGDDAVFYDCDNPDFTKFIEDNTGYTEAWGTFSDISTLAPACRVAAVNLSCGYYHAHTLGEEVNVEEMLNTIETVKQLLTVECEQFEYIKKKYNRYGYGYGYGYGRYGCYDDYDDYDDDDWYNRYRSSQKKDPGYEEDKVSILYVTFWDVEAEEEKTDSSCATSEEKAWLNFFRNNPNTCWNDILDYEIDQV